MNKKLLCGFAALGLMANNTFADSVIEDFENSATEFGEYVIAYKWGDVTLNNKENEYSPGNPDPIYDDEDKVGNKVGRVIAVLGASDGGAGAVAIEVKSNGELLESCVNGFSYRYKGAAHTFKPKQTGCGDAYPVKGASSSSEWTTATIKTYDAPGWSDGDRNCNNTIVDLSKIEEIAWEVKTGVSGSQGSTVTLSIDDFTCLTSSGGVPPIEPPPPGDGESYYIFEHRPATTENYATAYSKVPADQYLFGFSYPETSNFGNPTGNYGVIWVDEGVGKLKDAVMGAAPSQANDYLSMGSALGIKNNPAGESPNLGDCNGISYHYKGAKHSFQAQFSGTLCETTEDGDGSNKWGVEEVDASTNSWTQKTISLNQMTLYNTWAASKCGTGTGQTNPGAVDMSKVKQIVWELNNKLNPSATVSLMVANVVCLTGANDISPSAPSNSIAITTGAVGGDGTPVIGMPAIAGLTVVPFARSLQITSAKDATVSLFDIHGKSVLTQRITAGKSTTVSLEKQKQGLYYAVVQSGAAKQIVKVVVR